MAHDRTEERSVPRTISVFVLAWPIAILLLEATSLTPFVEFSKGGMALLASPHLLTAGIVALAAFFLIVMAMEGRDLDSGPTNTTHSILGLIFSPWSSVRWIWLGGHVLILLLYVWLTLTLHSRASTAGVPWSQAITWLLTGTAVALSILLAFIPMTGLISIARHYLWQVGVATAIGTGLIMMTPAVRGYWPEADGPALEGLNVLLNIYPGQSIVSQGTNRWPIIGTSRISLLVTPACSELDSLLVFVLLGGTLWAAMGARLSAWKYLLYLLAGLAGLYILLSIRLYLMVLIGLWAHDAYVAVKFAHSRISTLTLLLYTLGVLYLAGRFARPAIGSGVSEGRHIDEELESAETKALAAVLNS